MSKPKLCDDCQLRTDGWVLVKKGVLDCAVRQNEVLDSICQGKGDYVVIRKKDFNAIWKCNCGGLMKHQKEIHTFVCLKCGKKEWYPQRQHDKSLTKEVKAWKTY